VELLNYQPNLRIKIQSRDDSDSDSVSEEEGQEDALACQVLGTMLLGLPPRAKRFLTLVKSPLQAALQVAHSQGGFTLSLRNCTLTTLACNRGFMKIFHLTQTIHGAKTASWMGDQASLGAFKK
jgi:hypothetical protein